MVHANLNDVLILEDFSVLFGMLLEFLNHVHLFLANVDDFGVSVLAVLAGLTRESG